MLSYGRIAKYLVQVKSSHSISLNVRYGAGERGYVCPLEEQVGLLGIVRVHSHTAGSSAILSSYCSSLIVIVLNGEEDDRRLEF